MQGLNQESRSLGGLRMPDFKMMSQCDHVVRLPVTDHDDAVVSLWNCIRTVLGSSPCCSSFSLSLSWRIAYYRLLSGPYLHCHDDFPVSFFAMFRVV
jgi:hypothetical protein